MPSPITPILYRLRMFPQKFGPDRFSRFDVYWIQTNKQTDKLNLYIDVNFLS